MAESLRKMGDGFVKVFSVGCAGAFCLSSEAVAEEWIILGTRGLGDILATLNKVPELEKEGQGGLADACGGFLVRGASRPESKTFFLTLRLMHL